MVIRSGSGKLVLARAWPAPAPSSSTLGASVSHENCRPVRYLLKAHDATSMHAVLQAVAAGVVGLILRVEDIAISRKEETSAGFTAARGNATSGSGDGLEHDGSRHGAGATALAPRRWRHAVNLFLARPANVRAVGEGPGISIGGIRLLLPSLLISRR